MAQTSYPTGKTPATVARWQRLARLIRVSSILAAPGTNPYGLTVSGLTATIGRGTTGKGEAWVSGFIHEHDAADYVEVVPPNPDPANARVDRFVLRWDPAVEEVLITRLQGTPAASPVAPALVQTPDGVYDLPLWRFTVPANNGAPLTGLVDDRYYLDVDTGWQGYPGAYTPAKPTVYQVTGNTGVSYCKTAEGMVHVWGQATTSATTVWGTLPAGFRPAATVYAPTVQSASGNVTGYASVTQVDTGGNLSQWSYSGTVNPRSMNFSFPAA